MKRGQYDLAIEDHTMAISLKSDYAAAYCNRGIADRAPGEERKTQRDFERCDDLNGDGRVVRHMANQRLNTAAMCSSTEALGPGRRFDI